MRIAEIYFHPVKGCSGSSARRAMLTPKGLENDRRFMLVDDNRKFVSRRNVPHLALVRADILRRGHDAPKLALSHEAGGNFEVEIPPIGDLFDRGPSLNVTIHGKPATGIDMGEDSAAWFSDALGLSVRLVYQSDLPRTKFDSVTEEEYYVSYADAFPLLVTSQASLEDLNQRLQAAGQEFVGVDRFRPNIVLGGCDAFAEDGIGGVRIGDTAEIVGSTQCTRCTVIDVNPQTGVFDSSRPVYNMLRRFRDVPSRGVCLGLNAIVRSPGLIKVGDTLVPIEQ